MHFLYNHVSKYAVYRITSLKSSNEDYPVNIILIDTNEDVVAHCRLSTVSDDPQGLLIETGMSIL